MVNVKAITDERITRWKNLTIRRHSTPLLLISLGHDHRSGELTVYVTEDRTDEETLLFLKHAVTETEKRIAEKN